MQTDAFRSGLEALGHISRQKRVAIMCAEAVPWRCHRSLVADALAVRGITAIDILSETSCRAHKLTPFARVEGTTITYPPDQMMRRADYFPLRDGVPWEVARPEAAGFDPTRLEPVIAAVSRSETSWPTVIRA